MASSRRQGNWLKAVFRQIWLILDEYRLFLFWLILAYPHLELILAYFLLSIYNIHYIYDYIYFYISQFG